MPVYVMATITGKEDHCKKLIEETVPGARAFIPQKTISKKYEGAWHEERRTLFPGYLFVETEDIKDFVSSLPRSFFNTFMKVIGRSDDVYLHVTDEELEMIKRLAGGDGLTVAMSKGVKDGTNITFTSGPLVGMEGFVKKVDRHKRTVTLEVEMFGRLQNFTVGAEIISAAAVID